MADHVLGTFEGFTKKYDIKQLVHYEMYLSMDDAIRREKRIKEWQRAWKVRLIKSFNPEWIDLYNHTTGEVSCGPADLERGAHRAP